MKGMSMGWGNGYKNREVLIEAISSSDVGKNGPGKNGIRKNNPEKMVP